MATRSLIYCTAAALSILLAVSAFAETPQAEPQPLLPSVDPIQICASSPASVSLFQPEEVLAQQKEDASSGSVATANASTEWRWRRTTIPEYAAIAAAIGGTLYVEQAHGEPGAQWKAQNDFDEGIRDALRIGSRSGRDAVHNASNAIMGLMIGAPVLDAFATLGLRDSRWDALWETEMINLESFTVTSLVSALLQTVIVPRERPFLRTCRAGNCESGQENRSMPSGHVAFAFTGAGLICNHHDYQSLYGNPAADRAVCTAGIVLSAVDGVLRIMADRHYATDVLAGTAIGLFSGFVLPRWLHYDWPQSSSANDEKNKPLRQLVLAPMVLSDGGGLSCSMRF